MTLCLAEINYFFSLGFKSVHLRNFLLVFQILLLQLLLEEVMNSSTLSKEVSDLVEMVWAEALGHLEHTLLKPANRISLNDVSHVHPPSKPLS